MTTTYRKDNLTVHLCADRDELGAQAAEVAAASIAKAIAEREEARVIFGAAPSQNETLAALLRDPRIDWTKVVAMHMDEYVGLPVGSESRFSCYLRKHIAELVPFKKVYYIDEEKGASVEEMIERYENIINEGPIDVVCMGIGENGHVAFNDPPVADFNDPELIKLVELDDACRRQQVNDGCFPDFASTPTHALTLTIPALARGAVQVCAVPGKLKAPAVKRTLEGPISTECPATILRVLTRAHLFVDADSHSLCELPTDAGNNDA